MHLILGQTNVEPEEFEVAPKYATLVSLADCIQGKVPRGLVTTRGISYPEQLQLGKTHKLINDIDIVKLPDVVEKPQDPWQRFWLYKGQHLVVSWHLSSTLSRAVYPLAIKAARASLLNFVAVDINWQGTPAVVGIHDATLCPLLGIEANTLYSILSGKVNGTCCK